MTYLGRVVGEKYRVLYELGRGGMGSVWVADHVDLSSKVAIKFIDARLAEVETVRNDAVTVADIIAARSSSTTATMRATPIS